MSIVLQVAMVPPMALQLVELIEPFGPMLSQWVIPPPIFMQVLVWATALPVQASVAKAKTVRNIKRPPGNLRV